MRHIVASFAQRSWLAPALAAALLWIARPGLGLAQKPASSASSPMVAASKVRKPVESFAATMPTREAAGFRMEGAPQIEVVFGDIALYKHHIDTYRRLHAEMEVAHASFAKATHRVQRTLAALKKTRKACPVDSIAQDYARASESGLLFRRLGAALETSYLAMRELDELGESVGLTPDYRWQVRNSKRAYQRALTDLREMRSTFTTQIEAEARVRGCDEQVLLARAEELRNEGIAKSTETDTQIKPGMTVVVSSTATFFVDNQKCDDAVRVYVDNTLLGEVPPDRRAAFQSLAGRHSICILAADDSKNCGDAGTVRTAFVHNGFALSRSCASPRSR